MPGSRGLSRAQLSSSGSTRGKFEEKRSFSRRPWWAGVALLALLALPTLGLAVDVTVVDGQGAPLTTGYRWLLQEDTTYHVDPGLQVPNATEPDHLPLGAKFHTSHAPVISTGASAGSQVSVAIPDPTKHYYISVLPDEGHAMGAAPIAPGQTTVTVTCHTNPIPTATISVFIFEDNQVINNAPDRPAEQGLANFKITLEDGGGRYGISAGVMINDAFGNLLGTTYDENGDIVKLGDGVITTDENGRATIRNVPPGKYGIIATPPIGENWVQTSTIEGKRVIDAWVKANEPEVFVEFGPPGVHVFMGFVQPIPTTDNPDFFDGSGSISGQVVALHASRPPEFTFWPGATYSGAWVGLNTGTAEAGGVGVFAQPCDDEGNFTIPNVPDGRWQLAVWDENLNLIFGLIDVVVQNGQAVELGPVPIFEWFHHMHQYVFHDDNENGFWDEGEVPMPEILTSIRWRDGTVYQEFPTDLEGAAPYDEVFPFFHWLVAEVGFSNHKATGATIIVDEGGEVLPDAGWDNPTFDRLKPMAQFQTDPVTGEYILDGAGEKIPAINPNTGNNLSRTETGEVLTQAFQGFLGQTNVIQWGKKAYAPGENGGISGMAVYATTRAVDDPTLAAAEPWEPGIPNVQMILYADVDNDRVIDDLDGDGVVTVPTVDTATQTVLDYGDALNVAWTDSWDAAPPVGTQGERFLAHPDLPGFAGTEADGFDGLRNFNQVRPGLFDGGYAFNSWVDAAGVEQDGLPSGFYIVEAVAPTGYLHQKEEDKNVDFGDEFVQSQNYDPNALSPAAPTPLAPINGPAQQAPATAGPYDNIPILCGDVRPVPNELSLFPGIPCAFAGEHRPLPNRKQVKLVDGRNAAADFFLFTEVPIAGQIVGVIVDDVANEFDPNAPAFGEKYSPPWLPISVRDWTGHVITRTYSDEWGAYNALVPSTFTNNLPMPSGMSPNMLTVVLNDPGPVLDEDPASSTFGQYITDPHFNRNYSQFSYTFQYMPGTTTYLDTPVVPIGAFAGSDQFPVDCDLPDGTPAIYAVSGPDGGPFVSQTGTTITITSNGMTEVENPAFGVPGEPATILRDYGFGSNPGVVTLGSRTLPIQTWAADGRTITCSIPAGTTTGQLTVVRGDTSLSTPIGVTVTVGLGDHAVLHVNANGGPNTFPTIQSAIDAAAPGDLVLVAPGTYEEIVIMWKPVRLQGWGAYSTAINAVQSPSDKIQDWRTKIHGLWLAGEIDLLEAQQVNFIGIEPALADIEGAGICVFGRFTTQENGGYGPDPRARIDGLTVYGASTGGGIALNGFARHVEIGNNRVIQNSGFSGGGIRIGHASLVITDDDGNPFLDPSRCDNVRIHHNLIAGNGSLSGAGGGISIYSGADGYDIRHNLICGNFSLTHGGGIGHLGTSHGGVIEQNTIHFNQCFSQQLGADGGGIYISGGAPLVNPGLSPGSGDVRIVGNHIQGNNAGSGDGAGIALVSVNGLDVFDNGDIDSYYRIDILNNTIVNNVAGLAGGGLSLQDALRVYVLHNTIAHNDSTATAGRAFSTGGNNSSFQPAGIVSRGHSAELLQAIELEDFDPGPVINLAEYSNPVLWNNVIWRNRSFHFVNNGVTAGDFGILPPMTQDPAAFPNYWDLGVLGVAGVLDPEYSILTDDTFYSSTNIAANPLFVSEYFNGDRGQTIVQPEFNSSIAAAVAFDEGGNFIEARYGPLSARDPQTGELFGDYHVDGLLSPALDLGSIAALAAMGAHFVDTDGDMFHLSSNGNVHAGSDEGTQINNIAPRAGQDSYTMVNDGAQARLIVLAPGVLANDADPDSGPGPLFVQPITMPEHGDLVLSGNGSFVYNPNGNYRGPDQFVYLVTDGSRTGVGVVQIDITRPRANRRPRPTADPIVTEVDQIGTTRVQPNDPDLGDSHTFTITRSPDPAFGTAIVGALGLVSFTPEPGVLGSDWLRVRVEDQDGRTGSVRIDLSVIDQVLPPTLDLAVQIPPDEDGIDTDGDGIVDNDHQHVLLSAGDGFTVMADGYQQYMFGFADLSFLLPKVEAGDPLVRTVPLDEIMAKGTLQAMFPAPLLHFKEGQKVYLNLTNVGMVVRPDLFDPHSVHWHGFPNAAPIYDGVPESSVTVNMMSNLAYFYQPMRPGTYMYHCHVEATEHMQMGMLGNLYVEPMQNNIAQVLADAGTPEPAYQGFTKFVFNDGDGSTGYDVEYSIQMGSFDQEFHDASYTVQPLPFAQMEDDYAMLNGRGYPDTTLPGPLAPAPENIVVTGSVLGTADGAPADPNRRRIFGSANLSSLNGEYEGLGLIMLDGPAAGTAVEIEDYIGSTRRVRTFAGDGRLPVSPNVGDTFAIGRLSQVESSRITATQGERILLRISDLNVTRFYTLGSTLPMRVVGKDASHLRGPGGEDLSYLTNSVTLGGGESVSAIIDTADVAPGTYLLYSTNLNYLTNNDEDFGGMMTEIVIEPAAGLGF